MPDDNSTALVKVIQRAVVAHLRKQVELDGVTVIGPREGVTFSELDQDIEAAIDAAIAEAGGACLYVPAPEIVEIDANSTGPYADKMEVRVRCIEDAKLNVKLPDVFELAEFSLTLLHEQTFTEITGLNQLLARTRPIESQPDPKRLIRDVVFLTSCGLPARGRQTS